MSTYSSICSLKIAFIVADEAAVKQQGLFTFDKLFLKKFSFLLRLTMIRNVAVSLTFEHLECLAEASWELSPGMALTAQRHHFQSAPLEELLLLLDQTAAVYTALQPCLPLALRQSARQETAFYAALVQERCSYLPRALPSQVQQVA